MMVLKYQYNSMKWGIGIFVLRAPLDGLPYCLYLQIVQAISYMGCDPTKEESYPIDKPILPTLRFFVAV